MSISKGHRASVVERAKESYGHSLVRATMELVHAYKTGFVPDAKDALYYLANILCYVVVIVLFPIVLPIAALADRKKAREALARSIATTMAGKRNT